MRGLWSVVGLLRQRRMVSGCEVHVLELGSVTTWIASQATSLSLSLLPPRPLSVSAAGTWVWGGHRS